MELIVFCGIQASGKSSFYKEFFFNSHLRVSLDLLKTRNREKKLIDFCFETQMPFVIDNTNPAKEDRTRYISQAKYRKYKIKGYYFQSSIEQSLARNNERDKDEYIPEVGIKNTFRKMELPDYNEGFDELYYVYIENNKFVIKEWDNEI